MMMMMMMVMVMVVVGSPLSSHDVVTCHLDFTAAVRDVCRLALPYLCLQCNTRMKEYFYIYRIEGGYIVGVTFIGILA